MAGLARPNVDKLKSEGRIKFLEYNDRNGYFDNINTLLDGDINWHNNDYGCLLGTQDRDQHIIFEIFQKSNIWGYGTETHDSGGGTPKPVNLYKKVNEDFVLYKKEVSTYNDKWYLLFENLEKGIYKITPTVNYANFTEWYVEDLDNIRFLIKQNNDYYSLKSNFYCIGQPQSNTELENWYEKYGVDEPNVLLKPINKEQINMSLDEATQIWSTDKPIDFNRIKDTIELIEEENSKSIQYDISPYRIYDRLNSDAILTMATDKENN